MSRFSLAEAKHWLRIPSLWAHFGFNGQPKRSCRCPWRNDQHPSFSVFGDGLRWHDFTTGEGGDAIDFVARAAGLSRQAACRTFITLATGCAIAPIDRAAQSRKPRPKLPFLERGSDADLRQLAELRNLSMEGLQLAVTRGLLRFATIRGFRSWILIDGARLNAQGRRLDGGQWEHLEGKPKAWTLPGCCASWPIGANESKDYAAIAFVEGAPDLLAACHFIWCEGRAADCATVCMLGAGHRVPEEALFLFTGKRIRIFGHADESGKRAVETWADQLTHTGAAVDAFEFDGLHKVDGTKVKDLNDLTWIHADDFEACRSTWGVMP